VSFLRNILGLDKPASPDLPVAPDAPLPAVPAGETASVKKIAGQLGGMEPARARLIAAAAYLLGRAANADLEITDDEAAIMKQLAQEIAGLDADAAAIVVELARLQTTREGATEDWLVAREFKAISTPDQRVALLRYCFVVAAANDEIDANESWLINRLAEELDVPRPDLNLVRAEFHEQLSAVRAVREAQAS
jgi:uncharacterized tellurite resistance protein B-like protein